jgi:hypothetical protein
MHLHRLLTLSVYAAVLAACDSGRAEQPRVDKSTQQATLPEKLCDLLPQAEAERIMGKPLVEQRNDDSGCAYQDARGTGGTGLWVYLNALEVEDQCRLTGGSEPLSGVGDEACIAVRIPAGLYTTVVFGRGGQTFEVVAPGENRASELSTAIAKVILSKLGT